MNLSPNFTLSEALASSTAIRLGIENIPSVDQLANMRQAAKGMEEVRTTLNNSPIHVDSWLRVEALERELTAKDYKRWCNARSLPLDDNSWAKYFARKGHPKGFSVDFICPSFGTPSQVAARIAKSGIKFDQLILEGTWVHISFAPEMRQEILLATFVNGVPTYSHGLVA